MKILLTPDLSRSTPLREAYDRAFKEATDLYIASAYLTDWSVSKSLGNQCKRVWFFVGTDFGLSRKKAMLEVLRWLPRGASFLFSAVSPNGLPGGFHPKIVFWKTTAGKFYCVLGSANLSKAAFHNNYEANAFFPITKKEFEMLASWLAKVQTVPITPDWIRHKYKEAPVAKLKKLGGPNKISANFKFKTGLDYTKRIQKRRQQQFVFNKLANDIRSHLQRCADGNLSNGQFWVWFWQTWASKAKNWRFQGSGLEITGKHASWRQACQALTAILNAAPSTRADELDHVVSEQLDRLAKSRNPARGAWFSEMLCHFFPDRYPLKNGPVQRWLMQNHYRGTKGLTQGQRYTELARQLRAAVASRPAGARNLAELDTVIWAQASRTKSASKKPEN
ncbi:MAG TPA: hypothetical protein VGF82_25975 [Terracidiphilus sp.]|jgi:hypothetical protein